MKRPILWNADEKFIEIIEKIKKERGLQTDQDVLIHLLSNYNEQLDATSEGQPLHTYEYKTVVEPNNLKPIEVVDKNSYGILTYGQTWMFHTKLFPVSFVLYNLKKKMKDSNWVEFEPFKSEVKDRAQKISGGDNFYPGMPKSEKSIAFSNKIRKSWSDRRKREEVNSISRKSRDLFSYAYIGEIIEKTRKGDDGEEEKYLVIYGAAAEWGFIEAKTDGDTSYITLTELGKEFVSFDNPILKMLINDLPNDRNMEFKLKPEEVGFLIKKVFKKYPLEYEAMKMMIAIREFGTKEEISGADEIRDEFWKIQEPYLKKNNPEPYELKKELFTKDNHKNPKLRGLAIMGKLLQMGIFEKDGKSKYKITELGKGIGSRI